MTVYNNSIQQARDVILTHQLTCGTHKVKSRLQHHALKVCDAGKPASNYKIPRGRFGEGRKRTKRLEKESVYT